MWFVHGDDTGAETHAAGNRIVGGGAGRNSLDRTHAGRLSSFGDSGFSVRAGARGSVWERVGACTGSCWLSCSVGCPQGQKRVPASRASHTP